MKLHTKIVSSLEKIFATDKVGARPKEEKIRALRGERVSFQFAYKNELDEGDTCYRMILTPKIEGALAPFTTIRRVMQVPVVKPVCTSGDDNYLSKEPGLFPDLLIPLTYGGRLRCDYNVLGTLWIDIDVPSDYSGALTDSLTVSLSDDSGNVLSSETIETEVIDALLPEGDTYYTRWFHCDCLAMYYNVPVWSKRHWEIIENFIKGAVKIGINTLLTPLITPSLDGPRMITQLVKIKKNGEKYSFDFRRLGKWIDICDRAGIKYFEISHLFTQGGAVRTPRISANVDGEEKLIFTYETDSRDGEYRIFLRALLTAFLRYMKKRGADKRCIFHISDEPHIDNIEYYRAAKECIADIVKGYKLIDALSDIEYYNEGLVECPVPITRHAEDFYAAGIDPLWTYYCTGPGDENFSNDFIPMPSYRTRSIGMQMYKYNIEGFLHWGYNFYNNCESDSLINPFIEFSGDNWVPAGDPFIVYPSNDGHPIESLRAEVMYHAFEDIRAMKLCESLYSRETVVAEMEKAYGKKITFTSSAYSTKEFMSVRERINDMIKAKI